MYNSLTTKRQSCDKNSYRCRLKRDMKQNWTAYLMVVPVLAFYLIFCYKPMYGVFIAFKDYSIRDGILGSPWVGLKYFESFFKSFYFLRLMKNTLTISLASLIFGFPIPIIFALLLNEIRNNKFKRTIQTISYMPHFISIVVICSLVRIFTSNTGMIVDFISIFGYDARFDMLTHKELFVPIYIISDIWQETGWNCIIYLSALVGIDISLYESAHMDGANRWQQTLHITIPGIMSTVVLLLILRMGSLMSVGYEKIILLYNDGILDTADVISTYIYRRGLLSNEFSYSTAIGLFNSVINITLVIISNKLSKKISGMGIW